MAVIANYGISGSTVHGIYIQTTRQSTFHGGTNLIKLLVGA